MYVAYITYLTCTYFDLARQTGFALRPPACITYMSSILIRRAACKGRERPDLYSSQEKCSLSRLLEAFFIFFLLGGFQFGCMHVCTIYTYTYVHTYILTYNYYCVYSWLIKSLFFSSSFQPGQSRWWCKSEWETWELWRLALCSLHMYSRERKGSWSPYTYIV